VSPSSKRVCDQADRARANATKSSDHNAGYMILIIHSGGSDKAFLTLTEDEIYAMTCAEGRYAQDSRLSSLHALKMAMSVDTRAEHVFLSVEEDNPIGVKMMFTLGT
jgi:hypothetical protein